MQRRDLAALAVTAWGVSRMAAFARRRAPRTLGEVAADVVAVVPARDEERRVGGCVRSLLATGVREVVVVDDGSTDATGRVAAEAGASVVTAPPLAPGHAGKAAACLAGARAAGEPEWLWFVDADVTVAPDALSRLLAVEASLVSAYGTVETPTVGLAWLLPEVGLSLARRDPAPFANGQCLLVRRDAYPGHDPTQVVEDVALARAAGGARNVLAPDLFRVALYDSLPDALRGLHRSRGAVPPGWREALWLAAALTPAGYAAQVVVSAAARAVSGVPVAPAVAAPFADALLVLTRLRPGRATWKGRPV
ncbi:MAG TPA: glycosyltransferase family 2 protein [Frankiaceae bacterium]|nr:glycosyltransferase family 2 protein [Frankiaceae bacterium]